MRSYWGEGMSLGQCSVRGLLLSDQSAAQLYGLHLLFVTLLCLSLPGITAAPSLRPTTAAQDIYTDALAPGWSNWSWATVDLQASAPVHSGSRSIAVTYGAWQALHLHYPELPTVVASYSLRGGLDSYSCSPTFPML